MADDAIKNLLESESRAIKALLAQREAIAEAAKLCANCKGRIIATGLGKSGIAAKKIASTLTSIGAQAIFLHPTEALHGDLGIVSPQDVAICISKSGETEEITHLVAFFKRWGIPIIAITANKKSLLYSNADLKILIPEVEEGEPLGVIPTTSVVCSIAAGDAIAAEIISMKGITKEKFRQFHPGGLLGRNLTKVSELMHTGDEIPIIPPSATLKDAIIEITQKKLGTTLIMDGEKLIGILTDGDVRRAVQREDIEDPLKENVLIFATRNPKWTTPDALAEEALRKMENYKITSLVVMEGGKVVGFIHMHDILGRKIV